MPKNKKKKNDPPPNIPGMAPPPQQAPAPQRAPPKPRAPAPVEESAPITSNAPGWGSASISTKRRDPVEESAPLASDAPGWGSASVSPRKRDPGHQQSQQTPGPGGRGSEKHHGVEARAPGGGDQPAESEGAQAAPPARPEKPEESVTKDMKVLRLGSDLIPPQKRLDPQLGHFPGKSGKNCQLRVNHFRMKIPTGIIYQYSVKIVPPWARAYKKADKDIYQLVINEWREVNVVAKKAPKTWVFDGFSTLYCTKAYEKIPHSEINLQLEGETEAKVFFVTDIKIDKQIMISQDLAEWAVKGQSGESG